MEKELNKIIYSNIKFLAKKRQDTIEEVEKAAGVSKGYFSRCAKGEVKIVGFNPVIKVCEYFDIDINKLISKDFCVEEKLELAKKEYEEKVERIKRGEE